MEMLWILLCIGLVMPFAIGIESLLHAHRRNKQDKRECRDRAVFERFTHKVEE